MRKRLRHLPISLYASALQLVVGVPLGYWLGGGAAAAGVVAGIALVAVSFLISSLVTAWGDLVARQMLLPITLLTYVLKFTVFGVVLWWVAEAQWAGLPALGVAVIVGTIVWTGAQLWWILHAKIPYVEIEP